VRQDNAGAHGTAIRPSAFAESVANLCAFPLFLR